MSALGDISSLIKLAQVVMNKDGDDSKKKKKKKGTGDKDIDDAVTYVELIDLADKNIKFWKAFKKELKNYK